MSSSNEFPPNPPKPVFVDSIFAEAGPEADPRKLTVKQRGELGELRFAWEAKARRFGVSRPYGDSEHYDCNVVSPKKYSWGVKQSRVQVRSVYSLRKVGKDRKASAYLFSLVRGGDGRKYKRGDFDFLAAYVAPEDAWYIIPFEELGRRWTFSVYPHRPGSTRQFEKFRDRWDLLE